jgi:imidazole glycerol-phosphate synthase subunit HisH
MGSIAIVDYGMANLRSVQKALEKVGHRAEITSDPNRIGDAGKVILPGVGAFRDAIARVRDTAIGKPILDHIQSGRPFLGICLGLQMLFTRSHEDGVHPGLDLLRGEVKRFKESPGLKIPHMGWNSLKFKKKCPLFAGLSDGASVYFVHSFHAEALDKELTVAEADYPTPFTAAVWRDNVFATQFHPEKSQAVGLTILKNFAAM